MTHNPLLNHGIKLTYHGILKDAALRIMEYHILCVSHYFKIFIQSETTKFLSTVKRARRSPREKKTYSSHIHKIPGGWTFKNSPSVTIHHM